MLLTIFDTPLSSHTYSKSETIKIPEKSFHSWRLIARSLIMTWI